MLRGVSTNVGTTRKLGVANSQDTLCKQPAVRVHIPDLDSCIQNSYAYVNMYNAMWTVCMYGTFRQGVCVWGGETMGGARWGAGEMSLYSP